MNKDHSEGGPWMYSMLPIRLLAPPGVPCCGQWIAIALPAVGGLRPRGHRMPFVAFRLGLRLCLGLGSGHEVVDCTVNGLGWRYEYEEMVQVTLFVDAMAAARASLIFCFISINAICCRNTLVVHSHALANTCSYRIHSKSSFLDEKF